MGGTSMRICIILIFSITFTSVSVAQQHTIEPNGWYVGVCSDAGPGPYLSIYSNLLSPIDECTETGFRTVNKEVTVVVAQKNDAVFAPQYGVWKETSMPYYETGRVSGNYYYSDTEENGGYNHMELRRYKRAYNDPGNGIVKGDKAKPMDEAEQWLRRYVLN
jgi:hypothetical protein